MLDGKIPRETEEMPRETEENSNKDASEERKSMASRHPRNHGERLALNQNLRRKGRAHEGRPSRDQKGRAAWQPPNGQKPAPTVDEFDYFGAPDERITVNQYMNGQTPFINQLTNSFAR